VQTPEMSPRKKKLERPRSGFAKQKGVPSKFSWKKEGEKTTYQPLRGFFGESNPECIYSHKPAACKIKKSGKREKRT